MTGEEVRGAIEAVDSPDAKRKLTQSKLIVLDLKESQPSKGSSTPSPTSKSTSSGPTTSDGVKDNGEQPKMTTPDGEDANSLAKKLRIPTSVSKHFGKKVSTDEMMLFFQQLQTIYAVGINLVRGLELVQSTSENPILKKILLNVIADIHEGRSLSDAFERYPDVFDYVTINLMRAGEASGQLDKMLDRIASLYQTRVEQRDKINSATFYPKIVFGMIGVVFMTVVYFIIPKFKEFFSRFGGDLPLITRMMVNLSDFVVGYWWVLAGLGIGIYIGFGKFTATHDGIRAWHRVVLKLPVFGVLLLQADMSSFCVTFAMLIRSGVPITDALAVTRASLQNTVLQDEVAQAEAAVGAGQTIREGLASAKNIPIIASNLIGVGEEAGSLEIALLRLGDYYKIQVDKRLSTLSKAIEPILLAVVFGMVLALALAVFLPMWKMGSLIKK